MSGKKNRLLRYLRLGFVALAFVLYPYFVNQIPALGNLLQDVPLPLICVAAVVFAAIVVVGPELLNEPETSDEDLLQKFGKENLKLINQGWKGSLDRENYTPIKSVDAPEDLASGGKEVKTPPQKENSQSQSSPRKGLREWLQGKPKDILSEVVTPIVTRRQLKNLRTEEVTPLARTKPILEVFEEAKRRLLILGEPGSGKTTELLKLALTLAEEAENNAKKPIPVIFELSTWRGERMFEWMAEQMALGYGLNRKLCEEWLKNNRIVPLLDGLDELGEYRDGVKMAIEAIDTLQEDYQEQQHGLVICCRIEDYEKASHESGERVRLRLMDRAVRLCELTDADIEDYLNRRQARNLWEELPSKPGFRELARYPMLLNLMPMTYPDGFPKDAPQEGKTFQDQLFEDFVNRKLQKLKGYDPEKSRDYLQWLAASMEREEINQREFLIEGLQPTWLENPQQWNQYRLIFGLIFGLIGGLIFGLKAELKVRKYPNQGIWETGIKTLITMGLAVPLWPLALIVPNWATGQEVNLIQAVISGGLLGILGGIELGGGKAIIGHFSLRWVLCRHGQMPWNYARFLTEASNSGILKQSGGRYRFYHDKLREYLANRASLEIKPRTNPKIFKIADSWAFYVIAIAVAGYSAIIISSTTTFSEDWSAAMNPAIQGSDIVWFDTITYPRWRSPQRNDVILFSTTDLEEFRYWFEPRRILALPGETIEIRQGRILIDDKPFTNNAIKLPPDFHRPPITLSPQQYYVIGQNPDYPDLETFGAVISREDISGQLVLRLQPFDRFGLIR